MYKLPWKSLAATAIFNRFRTFAGGEPVAVLTRRVDAMHETSYKDRYYRRLHWKIVSTILCFSLIPLFALGFTIYYQYSFSYSAKVMESLRTMIENRRNTIDLFLEERLSQLNTLAYTHSFKQLISEDYLNHVFTLMQARSKSYIDLGVIDHDGNHIAYVGPYQLKGINYKTEEWFLEVLHRGVYISDVFTGFRRFPHFIIAVMRRDGDQYWILRATIDTEIFEAMVKAAQVGQRGDAFVVNRHGLLQTTPRFGGELLTRAAYPELSRGPAIQVEETEINGNRAFLATAWLRNKDWLLVIREEPFENLMPLFHARATIIILVTGGVLAIVIGAHFVTHAVVEQLIQADREKAFLDSSLVQSSKMAALGKLAAGIAHEVNNPLAVIKEKVGWVRDLLEEDDIAKSENYAEFEDAVKKIDYHVERARKITHRLLGFARRMEPIQENVDLNQVLEETIEFLKNEAHYRNIEIKTEFAPDLPLTLSDSSQIQQVFLNILNNAIDAIDKDGTIVVRTSYESRNQEVALSVSDDGQGIPPDRLNRIFDPFFTTKEIGTGTGLGLSISYSIVEKLGGRIIVASELGQGTTFTIYLPVVQGTNV